MTEIHSRLIVVAAVGTVCCLAVVAAPAGAQESWSSDVAIVLVRPSDRRSIDVKPEQVVLSARAVRVNANDRIESLLAANGIYADAESFAAVYRVNAGLESLELTAGTQLQLPLITGDSQLRQALGEGYLAALTLDVDLKRHLLESAEVTKFLTREFYAATRQPLSAVINGVKVGEAVGGIADFLEAVAVMIRERSRPLDARLLQQLRGEADVFIDTLKALIAQKRPMNRAEGEMIASLAENVDLRSMHFTATRAPGQLPPHYPEVLLQVSARAARSGADVHQLRVYYVPKALYKRVDPWQFATLTSPAQERLPVANYQIWIGKPGDPAPLSDVLSVRVRRPADRHPQVVELVVR